MKVCADCTRLYRPFKQANATCLRGAWQNADKEEAVRSMAEPTIVDIPFPTLGVEDVLRAEGYGVNTGGTGVKGDKGDKGADGSLRLLLRPGVRELYEHVLREVAALAVPKAIWTEVGIEGVEQDRVFLEGGYCLNSRLLSQLAGPAEKLVLHVMTLGGELDAKIARYQQEGKMTRALAMDSAGSAAIGLGGLKAVGDVERKYQALGLETSIPLGPGHSYWPKLDDQRTIFEILQPERIGITLSDSNLMLPRKSVSMVLAIGANLPAAKGKTHCDYCSYRPNCPMNRVMAGC